RLRGGCRWPSTATETHRAWFRAVPFRPCSSRVPSSDSPAATASGIKASAMLVSFGRGLDFDDVLPGQGTNGGGALLCHSRISPILQHHAAQVFEVGALELRNRFQSHHTQALTAWKGAPFTGR